MLSTSVAHGFRTESDQTRKGSWKAFFGKLYFDSSTVGGSFKDDFEFIVHRAYRSAKNGRERIKAFLILQD